MRHPRVVAAALASLATALAGAAVAVAAPSDVLVTTGSPVTPFSQNKQNEPAVAIDAHAPSVVAAGSNDEIDDESCAAGDPTTCPFTPGVGVSGIYFSFNGGAAWTQPTYTGWSARSCLGPAPCVPHVGPIGTLPRYYESGLMSDGDPALAFGPRPDAHGHFSWNNGSRLYYANLTANFPTSQTFRGFEAIAVSHTDSPRAAAGGSNTAWSVPAIISKQSSTTFSDKEQIWADNASSSKFFGNTYVCWASFRSNSHGNAFPTPLMVSRSTDGGVTWTTRQVGPATDNGINSQPDGCTVRTDSKGNVYVFGIGTRRGISYEMMYRSTDGGVHFGRPMLITSVVAPGVLDPVQGRPVMDGLGGARVDLAPAPSVDIANGAPSGSDATDQIVMTWVDGRAGLNHEQLKVSTSRDGGSTWSTATVPLMLGDRPVFSAPAISPNGTDVYVSLNAFTTPYRNDTTSPRGLVGEVWHANVAAGALTGWSQLHRGAVGDPRGSSANALTDEFLGDYVYAAATRTGVVAVWNDTRNAADCPAVDAYRASLYTSNPLPRPAVITACPAKFGNSDIRGAALADPTP